VQWNCFIQKVADKKYELHLIAIIRPGWHIYSSYQSPDSKSIPTNIKITTNPLLSFPGKPMEKGCLRKDYQYKGSVDFVRKVSVRANEKTEITGSIEFIACTDDRCLPAETINFRLPLN
jgi:DsbC/DsbD-like thiol-disulfide interchange protein